ncbi:hypothetical protein NA56DRAFT_756203 [Hyaloscypha hepaticicola]|uniref:Ecp2 effector protein domain-containing protein n=1 Tax=Hyaloscypha hepaticicola TaxID=2082293 RepID=A0A2J6PFX4_9HELO|nr:hypothetical protein NA56DRAFT_756203 [Hyaloscypha hepaticicola]
MKSFTGLVTVILALLANAGSAVPTYPGPPTSSVLDFTLYKTADPNQNQCSTPVDVVHVSPNDLIFYGDGVASTACNDADFYVGQIDTVAWGWNCQINVYEDSACSNIIGTIVQSNNWYPCEFPGGSLVNLKGWRVNCE